MKPQVLLAAAAGLIFVLVFAYALWVMPGVDFDVEQTQDDASGDGPVSPEDGGASDDGASVPRYTPRRHPPKGTQGTNNGEDAAEDATLLKGRVVDAQGKGLPGAAVESWDIGTNAASPAVATDKDGRFMLPYSAGQRAYLRVSKTGYAAVELSRVEGGTDRTVITLHPPATLSGRVLTMSGQSVDDYWIALIDLNAHGLVQQDELQDLSAQLTEERWLEDHSRHVMDAEGRFEFAGVAPGRYGFMVYPAKYSASYYGGGVGAALSQPGVSIGAGQRREDVEIRVKDCPLARAYIVDAQGAPVAGAQARLVYRRDEILRAIPGNVAITDTRGYFEIPLSNDNRNGQVLVSKEGYLPMVCNYFMFYKADRSGGVTPREPVPQLTLRELSEGGRVTGRITDAGGRPRANVPFVLKGELAQYRFSSNAAGEFASPHVQSGKYLFYRPDTLSDTGVAGEELFIGAGQTVEREYVYGKGSRVSGTVMRGGEALAGAVVALEWIVSDNPVNIPKERFMLTGADGAFEFVNILPGQYTLKVSPTYDKRGTAVVRESLVFDADRDVTRVLSMPLASVAGKVTNESGEALAGANVRLTEKTPGNPRMLTARADAQGRYVFEAVFEGEFELQAWAAGYNHATTAVQVRGDGALSGVDLRLPKR